MPARKQTGKIHNLNVFMTREMYREVRAAAYHLERPMADLIRECIDHYLDHIKKKDPSVVKEPAEIGG
jgi:predicted DNA-binding protein